MGNAQTQQNIGDFQSEAGKVTASLGLISSYFGAFICLLLAIGCGYLAFAKLSFDEVSTNLPCSSNTDCKKSGEYCNSGKCYMPPSQAKKHPWFLLGTVFFIAIAIYSVYYATVIKKIADSSRSGSQFIGTMGEIQFAKNLF